MKTSLVKIGRSYYAIIPNELWKRSRMPESGPIELTARKGEISISALKQKLNETS